jgi:hypothetical protein
MLCTLYLFSLGTQNKWKTYVSLHSFRGVIGEREDIIKTAADGLGKNGFINYYGLQVQFCEHLVFWKLFSTNTPCWGCFA